MTPTSTHVQYRNCNCNSNSTLLYNRTAIAALTFISPGTTPALAVVQAQDSDGYSPLMEAAAQGHLVVAKQLLRAHADTAMVNKVCSCGTTTAVHT